MKQQQLQTRDYLQRRALPQVQSVHSFSANGCSCRLMQYVYHLQQWPPVSEWLCDQECNHLSSSLDVNVDLCQDSCWCFISILTSYFRLEQRNTPWSCSNLTPPPPPSLSVWDNRIAKKRWCLSSCYSARFHVIGVFSQADVVSCQFVLFSTVEILIFMTFFIIHHKNN